MFEQDAFQSNIGRIMPDSTISNIVDKSIQRELNQHFQSVNDMVTPAYESNFDVTCTEDETSQQDNLNGLGQSLANSVVYKKLIKKTSQDANYPTVRIFPLSSPSQMEKLFERIQLIKKSAKKAVNQSRQHENINQYTPKSEKVRGPCKSLLEFYRAQESRNILQERRDKTQEIKRQRQLS